MRRGETPCEPSPNPELGTRNLELEPIILNLPRPPPFAIFASCHEEQLLDTARTDQLMHWIAPSEKDTDTAAFEKRLRDSADTATRASSNPGYESTWQDFRRAKDHYSGNPGLKSKEYSGSVHLG